LPSWNTRLRLGAILQQIMGSPPVGQVLCESLYASSNSP